MTPYADPAQRRARDREYGNARREARAQRAKRWRERNPDRQREHSRRHTLKTRFDLTPEDYDALLDGQEGLCAICGTADTAPWDYLCVDHDHDSGVVRGLLCHPCNVGIGQLGDDVARLRQAIAYLEAA